MTTYRTTASSSAAPAPDAIGAVLAGEIHSGSWGIAGKGPATADAHALQAQPAGATDG